MERESMTAFCKRLKITAAVKYGECGNAAHLVDEDDTAWRERRRMTPWAVTLKRGRQRLAVPFWTGLGCSGEPTAADVLSCLVSDASSGELSFPEFCSDFGADPDSRKAYATWQACKRLSPRVRRFLGEHFDAARDAEH